MIVLARSTFMGLGRREALGLLRPIRMIDPRKVRRMLGQGAPAASAVDSLQMTGAVVQVQVGPAQLVAQQQSQAGQTPSPGEVINALIDSGASISAIDQAAAQRLNLQATGSIQVGGVGGMSDQPVFAASVTFNQPQISFDPITLSGASLGTPDFEMLIGRNILCNLVFTYQGQQGTFTLVRP